MENIIKQVKMKLKKQKEKRYTKEEILYVLVKAIRDVKEDKLTFFDGGLEYPIYSDFCKWFEQFENKQDMKQTTVEFLEKELQNISWDIPSFKFELISLSVEQAKEMERQQKDEYAVLFTEWLNEIKVSDNQTYYNNTLGELLVIFKNK